MIEWLSDPAIWIGLLTLVILEIVLGIDNLIFIAILADKLPPHQRDRARVIGLSLALIMRLGLLAVISWIATLTTPLFALGPIDFSGRDLILLFGGLFLLYKATSELHERIEGVQHVENNNKVYASFAAVVTQIVILDAVFSLDAVITAVGMVDELPVMMAAVVISIGVMLLASKPLTKFVNEHPTVVILCLSFLLMIGFSLVAEGLGFKVPKGYLYAAIGFSILIEVFNQFSSRNMLKNELRIPLRERTANKVLSLLGTKNSIDAENLNTSVGEDDGFAPEERSMVSGVLSLGERKIRSLMTPASEIDWVDLNDSPDAIKLSLKDNPHNYLPVCKDELNNLIGVARAKDMLFDLMQYGAIQDQTIFPAKFEHEGTGVISLINQLRSSKGRIIVIKDEFNSISGLVTPVDLLEAIAGEFPDEDEGFTIEAQDESGLRWVASGAADIHYVQQLLEMQQLVNPNDAYSTLAGALLQKTGLRVVAGDKVEIEGWEFEVAEIKDGIISKVLINKIQ